MEKEILDGYNSPEGAAKYNVKWEKHWWERLNNSHEQKLLTGLLGSIPREELEGVSLDMPCGFGRVYPLIRDEAPAVVEGDRSFHLIRSTQDRLRESEAERPPTGFARGTALLMPFKDRAFQLVASIRLCHHISSEEERMQYVREVLRISSKWVLFTYFDTHSVKNRIHATKIRFVKKRSKWTLTKTQVHDAAEAAGFEVKRNVALSRLFSGHHFVLARRAD